MGQEKYEVWFAGIRGLGARKKYLLHEALKSCRNASVSYTHLTLPTNSRV